jgi:EAL and modified HD-GYP domain-containing signal transduction protein
MPAVQLKDYCFAHQPILDVEGSTIAIELLYRDAQPEAGNTFDDTTATANVIINICNHLGMIELMGKRKLFINVAEHLLLSDSITLLPKDKVTLELLEHIEVTEEILARIRELKAMGYEFALDDYVFHSEPCPLFDLVDIIKVDILHADLNALDQLVAYLRRWPCKLLAEKVENEEVHQSCLKAGFDLFQGYYFAYPTLHGGRITDPAKLVVLELLSKVSSDAELDEIEASFKGNPGLTYSLLRLISSPAFYASSHKIGSIRQAIQILGMRQLSRWLQVLLYTQQTEQSCLSLLELAVHRARLMELMASSVNIAPEQAYVAGMLSLADSALGVSMETIIQHLNLVEEIHHALLKREGHLGLLLRICEKLENGEFEEVAEVVESLNITIPTLMEMQTASIAWGNQMLHDLFEQSH